MLFYRISGCFMRKKIKPKIYKKKLLKTLYPITFFWLLYYTIRICSRKHFFCTRQVAHAKFSNS